MGVKASKLSKLIGIGMVGKRLKLSGASVMTPRGYVPVAVGVNLNESKRFMVHTTALYDAEFLEMLSRSAEEYGFHNQGILRIPYETNAFEKRMFNVTTCAGGSNRITPKIRASD
ncbi:auxin-responsive protein SAUR71-like [Solanum pennellii]|uniref:Auxin-responsive protein SAUR71-like n=1 Tax=Solanum pennellii TaxID=28526 RepID=A0ABM1GD79_SOLPN|nr:auxin-responsive protein SAUR71-like [Solanum pennellii]